MGMAESYSSQEWTFVIITMATTPMLMISYYFVVNNPYMTKYSLLIIFGRLFASEGKLIAQLNNIEALDTVDYILDIVVMLQRMNFLILCNIFNLIYFVRVLEKPCSKALACLGAGLPSAWMIVNLL